MNGRHLTVALTSLLAITAGCSIDGRGPTAPISGGAAAHNAGLTIPGTQHGLEILGGHGSYIGCAPRDSSFGSALIGPSGGNLVIGPHRLIIPPGALTQYVQISGSVPAGEPFRIELQPHGLTFKKAAGLLLDASSCSNVPSIVYLIDDVTPSDIIPAVYSNWWHTIAAPIWHFSGYAIGMRTDCGDGSDSDGGSVTLDGGSVLDGCSTDNATQQ